MSIFDEVFGIEAVGDDVDMEVLNKDAEDPVKDYFNQEIETEQGDEKTEGELIEENLDPVSATESYIARNLGLSKEDVDAIADETETAGNELIENEANGYTDMGADEGADTIDGEEISEDISIDEVDNGSDDGFEISEGDVDFGSSTSDSMQAAVESLRHIWSLEDEDESDSGETSDGGDIQLSVSAGGVSKDITISGGSVSISDGGSSDSSYDNESNSDEGDDEGDDEEGDDDEEEGDGKSEEGFDDIYGLYS